MSDPWHELIRRIHEAPLQAVIVVTGGGASAISELLSVPGGSRTVLEAVVPYSSAALVDWLGRPPDHFCVEETALAMAAVAYERAKVLAEAQRTQARGETPAQSVDSSDCEFVGVACTASLVSDRPKKGEHRCYIATQGRCATSSRSLVFEKGARDRQGEEHLVGNLILKALAQAAGIADLPALDLRPGEKVVSESATADPLAVELLEGKRGVVWSLPAADIAADTRGKPADGPVSRGESETHTRSAPLHQVLPFPHSAPTGLVCGAFHPLHFGHEQLRPAAERILGGPVYYEISLLNVDKPPLDFLSLERRRAQFTGQPLALTAAATFAEKASLLPSLTFVVGIDTAERIVDPRYYGGSEAAVRKALEKIREAGCRFLVAGRMMGDSFRTLSDARVPAEFASLFAEIPASEFRADVSSSQLRRAAAKPQA